MLPVVDLNLNAEVKVKGKPKELKDISFNFDQIKSTRVIINN